VFVKNLTHILIVIIALGFGLAASGCHSRSNGYASSDSTLVNLGDWYPSEYEHEDKNSDGDKTVSKSEWWKNKRDKPKYFSKRSTWNQKLSELPYDELKLQFSDRLIQHLHDFGYANWGLSYYPPIKEKILQCTMGIYDYHRYNNFRYDTLNSYGFVRSYKEYSCPEEHPDKIRVNLYDGSYVLLEVSPVVRNKYCRSKNTLSISIKDNYIPAKQDERLKECFMIYKLARGDDSAGGIKCIDKYYTEDDVEHAYQNPNADDIVFYGYAINEDTRGIANYSHKSLYRGTTNYDHYKSVINAVDFEGGPREDNMGKIFELLEQGKTIDSYIRELGLSNPKKAEYYQAILDCFAGEGSVFDKIDEYIQSDFELPRLDGVPLYKRDHSSEDFYLAWGEWSVPVYHADAGDERQRVYINTKNQVYKEYMESRDWNLEVPVPGDAYPAGSMVNFCHFYFSDVARGCGGVGNEWKVVGTGEICEINPKKPPTPEEISACDKMRTKLKDEKGDDLSRRDSHMVIIDDSTRNVWEFYNSFRRADGSLETRNMVKRNLDKRTDLLEDAPLANKVPSVRMTSVSLLEGLVARSELESGYINHALAYCNLSNSIHSNIPGNSKYGLFGSRYDFYPSLTMGGTFEHHSPLLQVLNGFGAGWTGRNTLKPGMRLQLEEDFDCEGKTNYGKVVCTALKEYGMVYVERCGGSGVYIEHEYNGPKWEDFNSWDNYSFANAEKDRLDDAFTRNGHQSVIDGLQMLNFRVVKPIKPPFFNVTDLKVNQDGSDVEFEFKVSLLIDANSNPDGLGCDTSRYAYAGCTNGVPPFKGFAGYVKVSLLGGNGTELPDSAIYCNLKDDEECRPTFRVQSEELGSRVKIKIDYSNQTIQDYKGSTFINTEYLDDVLLKYYPGSGNDEIDDIYYKLHEIQINLPNK
jgi:hypothetical protein